MKIADNIQPRSWEALKIKLEQHGLSSIEIKEAQNSFCQGIEVLSQLFLSQYPINKKNTDFMEHENKHENNSCK